MTTDELKKEAEEWIAEYTGIDVETQRAIRLQYHDNLRNAYIAGAEPREKRIAELRAICNIWFEHLKDREAELLTELNNQKAKYNRQIKELEKENARLATNEKSLLAERKIIAKENTEAKNLIEELASSLSVVGECGEEECELINKAQKFINKPIF